MGSFENSRSHTNPTPHRSLTQHNLTHWLLSPFGFGQNNEEMSHHAKHHHKHSKKTPEDGKSWLKPHDHKAEGWGKSTAHSNESEYQAETSKPSGYLTKLGVGHPDHPESLHKGKKHIHKAHHHAQKEQEPQTHHKAHHLHQHETRKEHHQTEHYAHNDTHSYIKPYDQREHAWTGDQMKNSHLKEYEEETKKPTHYTAPYNPASALQ
jgi:hypothetical protein